MLQVAVGVQVPNVSEGPVADLVEGGGIPSSGQGASPRRVGCVQVVGVSLTAGSH